MTLLTLFIDMNLITLGRVAAIACGLAVFLTPVPALADSMTWGHLYFRQPGWPGAAFPASPDYVPPVNLYAEGPTSTSLAYTSQRASQGIFDANAAAGVIQAYAYARNGINGVASPDEVWARGYIQDDFIVTGAAPGTPLSLMAYFTVNGVFSGTGGIANVTPPENAAVIARIVAAPHNQAVEQWARTEAQMGDCWQWGCPGWSTPFHRQFALELNVTAGVPFQIYYYLEVHAGWAYGGSGGTADFANTARLSFALPTGTAIDSAGGFSQTSDPRIPEPASILLTGVALLALAIRRLAIA